MAQVIYTAQVEATEKLFQQLTDEDLDHALAYLSQALEDAVQELASAWDVATDNFFVGDLT